MKKAVTLYLAAALMLALTACGRGNSLLENASPDTSALALYVYDGEAVTRKFLFDAQAEKALLAELGCIKAKPAPDWSPEQVALPVYALEIGGTDGWSIHAAWSNGYWVSADGTAYGFDFDFASLLDTYEFISPDSWTSTTVLPCLRHLTRDETGWHAALLTPSETLTPPAGVTMGLTEVGSESLQAEFVNDSGEEWCYGKYFSLQVLLEGLWYQVPPEPGRWAFEDIAMLLPAGSSVTETYNLAMYGSLPAGQYRLVVEGLTAEFTVS